MSLNYKPKAESNSTGKGGVGPTFKNPDVIDEILERAVINSSIFRNKNVLSMDYIPDYLPFREHQIKEIAAILSPILRHEKCSNILLYGKPGTGKTVVARYVLRKLAEKSQSMGLGHYFIYVNTRFCGTEYRVLWEISQQLGLSMPFTGLSIPELMHRLYSHLMRHKVRSVIVMDEIDFLIKSHGDDLLYELTRAKLESGDYHGPVFTLVGISNDLMFKELLDPRVLSSLGEEEIVFPPYSVDELTQILNERASLAFKDGCIDDSAISLCAALSGSEHGDARRAVELLRVAGEIAERTGALRVTEEHIREASIRIESDRIYNAISTLPLHAKLLLASCVKLHNATTGEVYKAYETLCRSCGIPPVTPRRATGILSELDALGLIQAEVVSSGRYGRTKRISLNNLEDVKVAILDEPFLKDILGAQTARDIV
jgi:cell division control protein 6